MGDSRGASARPDPFEAGRAGILARTLAERFPVGGTGLVRHVRGERIPPRLPDPDAELRRRRHEAYAGDLSALAAAFDAHAASLGLGVRMCVKDACAAALLDDRVTRTYHSDVEDGGRIHENQLLTALDVMAQAIRHPRRSILVLGALQSGKTGTGLCLQFLGPFLYLVTGVRTYPFQLVPNQVSHEAQARREFTRFLAFYGRVRFERDGTGCTLLSYMRDATAGTATSESPALAKATPLVPSFEAEPSLDVYRREVVGEAGTDPWRFLDPADVIRRRMPVGGRSGEALRNFVARMVDHGILPLPIADEAQYGASDRLVEGERRTCVLAAVLALVETTARERREASVAAAVATGGTEGAVRENLSGHHGRIRAVLLSATPYGLVGDDGGRLSGRAGIVLVPQRLPPGYVGLNCFMGLPIDPTAVHPAPAILDFGQAGRGRNAFLALVDLPLYFRHKDGGKDASRAFRAWALRNKVGRDRYDPALPAGPQLDRYCESVELALRLFVIDLVAQRRGRAADGSPLGICLRLTNGNARTFRLLRDIGLGDVAEVLPFYDKVEGGDVKGFLRAARREPDRPYVVAVTNRARMGDAFPKAVEVFVEFSRKASDLNGLLQGLLGRACGIGKNPTVIMSEANAAIARGYLARSGTVTMRASPHVVPLGIAEDPGSPVVARLAYGRHPAIDRFLDRVTGEIVEKVITGPGIRRQDRKAVDAVHGLYLPLYAIAEEEGVVDLVERKPGLAVDGACGGVRVLRPGESLFEKGEERTHLHDPARPGWVHAGFRTGMGGDQRLHRLRGHGVVVVAQVNLDPGDVRKVLGVTLPLSHGVPLAAPGVGTAVNERHALDAGLPVRERFERDLHVLEAAERAATARREAIR